MSERHEQKKKQLFSVVRIFVGALAFLALFCVLLVVLHRRIRSHSSRTNLSGLEKAMQIYGNDFDGKLPPAEDASELKWNVEEIERDSTAEWSEGKAFMKTIAVAIRAYAANQTRNSQLPADNDFEALGFMKYDLLGKYFKPDMLSFSVSSRRPLKFTITATNNDLTPTKVTLDQNGNWIETRIRK